MQYHISKDTSCWYFQKYYTNAYDFIKPIFAQKGRIFGIWFGKSITGLIGIYDKEVVPTKPFVNSISGCTNFGFFCLIFASQDPSSVRLMSRIHYRIWCPHWSGSATSRMPCAHWHSIFNIDVDSIRSVWYRRYVTTCVYERNVY